MKCEFRRGINIIREDILQNIRQIKLNEVTSRNDTIKIVKDQNQLLAQRVEHFQGVTFVIYTFNTLIIVNKNVQNTLIFII